MKRRRKHRRTGFPIIGVGTPNDVIGATANDVIGWDVCGQPVIGVDEAGVPVVGSFWGSVAHAINPVNIVRTAATMAAAPFRGVYNAARSIASIPGQETAALRALVSDPSANRGPGPAPAPAWGAPGGQPQYMPPGAYPPPTASPWGAAPAMPAQYAQPPGYPPAMPPQYSPSYTPPMSYDPNAYSSPQDFGTQPTGWDASYGGGY